MSKDVRWNPYLSKSFDVFICHRGPDSKSKVALPLKEQLERSHRGLTVFVDETDLPLGGDAPRNMMDALTQCKVCAWGHVSPLPIVMFQCTASCP